MESVLITIKKSFRKDEVVFYVAYLLFLFSSIILEYSELKFWENVETLTKLIELLMYFLLILKILLYTKYTKREFFLVQFIGICFFVSSILSQNTIMFKGLVLIIAIKNIELKEFIRFDMIFRIFFVLVVISFSLSGVIENYTLLRYDSNILRYSLGFIHPNTLSALVMVICFEWIYLKYNKLRYYDYLGVIIITLIINEVTDSRSSMNVTILMLVMTIYFKLFSDKFQRSRILKILNIYVVPICAIISILCCINYGSASEFMNNLNQLFSGRLNQGNIFIKNYGFSLMGQPVEIISYRMALFYNIKAAILDNAYVNIGIVHGSIMLVMFCVTQVKLIKETIKNEDYGMLVFINIFAIYGLMETYLFNIKYNFTLFFVAIVLYRHYSNRNKVK